MDRDTETLVMRGINIALLTECIALFFVSINIAPLTGWNPLAGSK